MNLSNCCGLGTSTTQQLSTLTQTSNIHHNAEHHVRDEDAKDGTDEKDERDEKEEEDKRKRNCTPHQTPVQFGAAATDGARIGSSRPRPRWQYI